MVTATFMLSRGLVYLKKNLDNYQNSEGHTFLFNLLYISGSVRRNNIKLSVKITDILPTRY